MVDCLYYIGMYHSADACSLWKSSLSIWVEFSNYHLTSVHQLTIQIVLLISCDSWIAFKTVMKKCLMQQLTCHMILVMVRWIISVQVHEIKNLDLWTKYSQTNFSCCSSNNSISIAWLQPCTTMKSVATKSQTPLFSESSPRLLLLTATCPRQC